MGKVKRLWLAVRDAIGPARVECPVCGWRGYTFLISRRTLGPDMKKCPRCGSKERHRHQICAFQHWGVAELLKHARVLHLAPEKRFSALFKESSTYLRIDIDSSNHEMPIDVCTDMSQCCFKSSTFDFVYASHVLEHIENVDDAISEIHRVVVPGGRAMLDVPVYGKHTEKLEERDHDGHLWHPGTADWFKRYEQAGFEVDYYPSDRVDPKHGVGQRSPITICKKLK